MAKPKSVIITGGGTGIGRAAAREFADQGASVLIVGRTKYTLDEAAHGYGNIRPLVIDITTQEAPERIVTTAVDEFGGLDVLVNNAGSAKAAALDELAHDQLAAQIATNLVAPVRLAQRALGPLRERSGTIVNLSTSGSLGLRSWPGNSIYGASKAALDFLTRSWAVELAPRGVRVVGIAPGVIATGMGLRNGMSEQEYAGFLEAIGLRVPLGRVGSPEEIAGWIVHLTTPAAQYVNGTVLAVDGALSVT